MAGVTVKKEVADNSYDTQPTSIKREPQEVPELSVSLVDLEERILQLCAENARGITEEVIKIDQPQLDAERRLKALERLLTQVYEALMLLLVG